VVWTLSTAPASQIPVLEEFKKKGVTVQRFPEPVLKALQAESAKVLAEEAKADPIFKEALDSLNNYMNNVNQWHNLQKLQ